MYKQAVINKLAVMANAIRGILRVKLAGVTLNGPAARGAYDVIKAIAKDGTKAKQLFLPTGELNTALLRGEPGWQIFAENFRPNKKMISLSGAAGKAAKKNVRDMLAFQDLWRQIEASPEGGKAVRKLLNDNRKAFNGWLKTQATTPGSAYGYSFANGKSGYDKLNPLPKYWRNNAAGAGAAGDAQTFSQWASANPGYATLGAGALGAGGMYLGSQMFAPPQYREY